MAARRVALTDVIIVSVLPRPMTSANIPPRARDGTLSDLHTVVNDFDINWLIHHDPTRHACGTGALFLLDHSDQRLPVLG